MAQTKAQKLRKRLKREGRNDMTAFRGGHDVQISTLTRRTKTKREAVEAQRHKHKATVWD